MTFAWWRLLTTTTRMHFAVLFVMQIYVTHEWFFTKENYWIQYSLPQSILVPVVKWRHHTNALLGTVIQQRSDTHNKWMTCRVSVIKDSCIERRSSVYQANSKRFEAPRLVEDSTATAQTGLQVVLARNLISWGREENLPTIFIVQFDCEGIYTYGLN